MPKARRSIASGPDASGVDSLRPESIHASDGRLVRPRLRLRSLFFEPDQLAVPIFAAAFATAIAGAGVPVLRHDWSWPRDRVAALWAWWSVAGTWTAVGLGAPNGYPNHAFANLFCASLQLIFGTHIALWLVLFMIAFYGASAARRLALCDRRDGILGISAAGFVLAAPWTYTEMVAGHIYTVAAGFAVIAVLAEARGARARAEVMVLAAAVAVAQLQLFLLVAAIIAYQAVYRRSWVALGATILIGSGPLVALLMHRGTLQGTPFALAWEKSQAVPPMAALATNGYFTHYTSAWPVWTINAVLFFPAATLLGAIFGRGRRAAVIAATSTIALIVVVSAPLGPLGALYAAAAERTPIVAVFRELYTLVVTLYAMYLIGLGALAARTRIASWAAFACVTALCVAWFMVPPSQEWLRASMLPSVNVPPGPGLRFALAPGLQPLAFRHRVGSGLDPDAYPRGANRLPLNVPDLRYPEAGAFQGYARSGNGKVLSELGVDSIISRPYLSTETGPLRGQGTNIAAGLRGAAKRNAVFDPRSFAAMLPLPTVAAIPGTLSDDSVLFSDARHAKGSDIPGTWGRQPSEISATPKQQFVDPAGGWTDARLAFLSFPWTAQPFGGAFTVAAGASLQVPPAARAALVAIEGELNDQRGHTLLHDGLRKFVWLRLSSSNHALFCKGRCLVATFSDGVPSALQPGRRAVEIPVTSDLWAPWLFSVNVAHAPEPQLVRFLARVDPAWVGFLAGSRLEPVRVDGVFAAWIVPARASGTAYFVDVAELFVLPLELLAAAVIAGCAVVAVGTTAVVRHKKPTSLRES